jgi:hypothetical protein
MPTERERQFQRAPLLLTISADLDLPRFGQIAIHASAAIALGPAQQRLECKPSTNYANWAGACTSTMR